MVKRNRKSKRNTKIFLQRLGGMTYKEIALDHGISISRVRQIIEAESLLHQVATYPG